MVGCKHSTGTTSNNALNTGRFDAARLLLLRVLLLGLLLMAWLSPCCWHWCYRLWGWQGKQGHAGRQQVQPSPGA
jgi:hypothetical protein